MKILVPYSDPVLITLPVAPKPGQEYHNLTNGQDYMFDLELERWMRLAPLDLEQDIA